MNWATQIEAYTPVKTTLVTPLVLTDFTFEIYAQMYSGVQAQFEFNYNDVIVFSVVDKVATFTLNGTSVTAAVNNFGLVSVSVTLGYFNGIYQLMLFVNGLMLDVALMTPTEITLTECTSYFLGQITKYKISSRCLHTASYDFVAPAYQTSEDALCYYECLNENPIQATDDVPEVYENNPYVTTLHDYVSFNDLNFPSTLIIKYFKTEVIEFALDEAKLNMFPAMIEYLSFAASFGTEPYTYTFLGAPIGGMTFNSTTGVLTGHPTVFTDHYFSILVVDALGCQIVKDYVYRLIKVPPDTWLHSFNLIAPGVSVKTATIAPVIPVTSQPILLTWQPTSTYGIPYTDEIWYDIVISSDRDFRKIVFATSVKASDLIGYPDDRVGYQTTLTNLGSFKTYFWKVTAKIVGRNRKGLLMPYTFQIKPMGVYCSAPMDYISTPTNTAYNITNTWTVECRFKTAFILGIFQGTSSGYYCSCGTSTYGCMIEWTTDGTSVGIFINNKRYVQIANPVNDSNFHHFAAVHNGTLMSMYYDGNFMGSLIDASNYISNAADLHIGDTGLNDADVAGTIAEVRFSNIARTFLPLNPNTPLGIDAATTSSWQFLEGTGTQTLDNYGRVGTFQGSPYWVQL